MRCGHGLETIHDGLPDCLDVPKQCWRIRHLSIRNAAIINGIFFASLHPITGDPRPRAAPRAPRREPFSAFTPPALVCGVFGSAGAGAKPLRHGLARVQPLPGLPCQGGATSKARRRAGRGVTLAARFPLPRGPEATLAPARPSPCRHARPDACAGIEGVLPPSLPCQHSLVLAVGHEGIRHPPRVAAPFDAPKPRAQGYPDTLLAPRRPSVGCH